MIKAIFLDLGGVIVDLDFNAAVKAFKENVGFERICEFLDSYVQKGFIAEMERGDIGEQEFYEKCRLYCRPSASDKELSDSFNALLIGIKPEKVDYLRELSSRYPLYMLSNINPIAMRHCCGLFDKAGLPVNECYKDLFLSYEMKMMKPGHEIFLESARRAGFEPSDILFIDDSPANVAAAAELGFNTAVFPKDGNLRATVEAALEEFNR